MSEPAGAVEIIAGAGMALGTIIGAVGGVYGVVQAQRRARAEDAHKAKLAEVEAEKVTLERDKITVEARLAAVEEERARSERESSLVTTALKLVEAEERAKNEAIRRGDDCEERVGKLTDEIAGLRAEVGRLREVVELQQQIDRQDSI